MCVCVFECDMWAESGVMCVCVLGRESICMFCI